MKHPLSVPRAIDYYLYTRRQLGFELKKEGLLLRALGTYARTVQHRGPLTAQLVLRWAQLPAAADPHWWARRLAVARQFAQFWVAFDARTELPPAGFFGPVHQRRPVHIYTTEEIAALAAATSNLGQTRAQTFRTFLGLLICTGLRISEALRLRPQDLDLSGNTLLVQAVKSSPARRLPIHASTHRALHQYDRWCQRRLRAPALRPALFLNSWGRPLSRDAADDTFEELRDRLGWRQCPRPRLYDLRHSFAVHWLVCWNRRPGTLDANILALSAYLGHRHVSDTYWYLTAVPELLAASSARFEQLAHRKPLALTP